MDSVSIKLSSEYIKRYGQILHHNVDKGLLAAGEAENRFGGGFIKKPMKLIFGDRATWNVEEEVIGECTMAKLWGFTPERIMLELDMDESGLRRDLRGMYIALKENEYVFREAYDRSVEPFKLLEWLIARYMSNCF